MNAIAHPTAPATIRPTVSAIVPTKNRPALLEVAVRGLLTQTVALDELIVAGAVGWAIALTAPASGRGGAGGAQRE